MGVHQCTAARVVIDRVDPRVAGKEIINHVPTLASGQELSHYRVISPLGAGGMGDVYLAEDLRLGRKVALKILSRALTANDDRVRRFRQEARTISACVELLRQYDLLKEP